MSIPIFPSSDICVLPFRLLHGLRNPSKFHIFSWHPSTTTIEYGGVINDGTREKRNGEDVYDHWRHVIWDISSRRPHKVEWNLERMLWFKMKYYGRRGPVSVGCNGKVDKMRWALSNRIKKREWDHWWCDTRVWPVYDRRRWFQIAPPKHILIRWK